MADELVAALVRELAALPEPAGSELVDAIARAVLTLARNADAREQATASQLLTVAEVAARLRVNPKWVYVHQHELGPIRLGDGPGARLRFDARAIDARINESLGRLTPAIDEASADPPQPINARRPRRRLSSRPLRSAPTHPRA